jgi:hypothetical protein
LPMYDAHYTPIDTRPLYYPCLLEFSSRFGLASRLLFRGCRTADGSAHRSGVPLGQTTPQSFLPKRRREVERHSLPRHVRRAGIRYSELGVRDSGFGTRFSVEVTEKRGGLASRLLFNGVLAALVFRWSNQPRTQPATWRRESRMTLPDLPCTPKELRGFPTGDGLRETGNAFASPQQ